MSVKAKILSLRLTDKDYERIEGMMKAQGKEDENISTFIRDRIFISELDSINSIRTDISTIKEELVNLKFGLEFMNKENENLFLAVLTRIALISYTLKKLPDLGDINLKNIQVKTENGNVSVEENEMAKAKKTLDFLNDAAFKEVFDYMIGKNKSDPIAIQRALDEYAKISEKKS